jgi:hypothetical protein
MPPFTSFVGIGATTMFNSKGAFATWRGTIRSGKKNNDKDFPHFFTTSCFKPGIYSWTEPCPEQHLTP